MKETSRRNGRQFSSDEHLTNTDLSLLCFYVSQLNNNHVTLKHYNIIQSDSSPIYLDSKLDCADLTIS